MNNMTKQLNNILLEEENHHSHLIELAKKMKSAIISNDSEAITTLSNLYDKETSNIIELEKKRLAVSDSIACTLLRDPIHLNLREIIKLITNEKQKEALSNRRTSLKKKIKEFSRLNMVNNTLLKDKIEDIDCNVRIIVENSKKPASYNKTGMMFNGKNSTKLFNQVG